MKVKIKKVILVDNNKFFRKALGEILSSIGGVEIVAEASNGKEFLETINTIDADIIFINIKLPIIDGVEATKIALLSHPNMTIIGFSSFDNQRYISQMLAAGARGYLSKNRDNYDLLKSIIENPDKGLFLSKEIEQNINIDQPNLKIV